MLGFTKLVAAAFAVLPSLSKAATTWSQVKIGGGGGFVPGIVFSPATKGVAFARTDIGGLYRLNSDDSWTPLLDWADNSHWNYWGVDALALHPTDSKTLYIAVGMYTNSWDPNNGSILKSTDSGATWSVASTLSFKVGGNMPGRGLGERLAIDPNNPSILFFGARSGNGLWKSTNSGTTWTKITAFPSAGTYVQDPAYEYTADIVGLSWVTFDKSSGTSGSATPRIFVGVANKGANNVFVSTNGGTSWSAVAGQNNTYIPHKGVIANGNLYISYADGAGPYDGTLGAVWKYAISTGVWTNITPVSGSDLYFGFGGLTVDAQVPGTIMVAALNSWWPDGQIFRSIDDGATWSPLWAWNGYPNRNKYYTWDLTKAPWISVKADSTDEKEIGWMMESLVIDPFDSNHWLYGTGLTIYGGHNLKNWDTTHLVTLSSLADGIEETAIQTLLSPPSGPVLVSGMYDVEGFVHTSLTTAPTTPFTSPQWGGVSDLDYAGASPSTLVRVGVDENQVALSNNGGSSWYAYSGSGAGNSAGKVALSADGVTIVWTTTTGVLRSQNSAAFSAISSLPSGAVVASDKVTTANFYAASGKNFYVSTNTASSFTATAGTLGSASTANNIIVNPWTSGDVWVTTDAGVFHTTNSGSTFSQISGFTAAWSISAGAPKTTGGTPAVYVFGTYLGTTGAWRSDDAGVNWVQIDDSTHRFAASSANVIEGDKRTYGKVYVGTNGRGIFVGTQSGTDPVTATSSSAVASSSSRASSSSSSSRASSSSSTSRASSSSSSSRVSSSSTSTSTAATATQTHYGQCGGQGWTGPTVCASPYVCTYSNDFYSQCL